MSAAPSPHERANDPRVGTMLGSLYEIVGVLGEGGIGTVYLAHFGPSRERVAIKLLRAEYSNNPELLARFEREASAMAGLVHENIVRAFDFGRAPDGALYMVMELAEGETLRDALTRCGALPLASTAMIARQIGAALTRAHAAGVVHRDLKPENVMVVDIAGPLPRAKVLDFGMARIIHGDLSHTRALTAQGVVLGSPSYMPPEQATGRPVDARADQYALGVMLYEMLSGRKPFEGDSSVDVLYAQVHHAPEPLDRVAPTVPRAVAAVVARMMSKRAADRYPDTVTAVEAFCAAADGARASLVAPPPPSEAQTWRPPRRHTGRSVLLAAAALALALAAAVIWLALRRSDSASTHSPSQTENTRST